MDKNKTDKKELLDLITKILADEDMTAPMFVSLLEKAFDRLKKEYANKELPSEEKVKEMTRVVKKVLDSTNVPSIVIAGCEDGNGGVDELAMFASGETQDILSLLGMAVLETLKNTGVELRVFTKALESTDK